MDYWWDILNLVLIFSIFAISLNLLVGYTGQVSVAHAAFRRDRRLYRGVPFNQERSRLLAGARGGGFRRGFSRRPHEPAGAPAQPGISRTFDDRRFLDRARHRRRRRRAWRRLRHDRYQSRRISIPCPAANCCFRINGCCRCLYSRRSLYLICRRFGKSAWGRVLRAIRDDEIAARALGCNVVAFKVVVFGITSAFAGLAGVLLFYYNQIASPSVYGLDVSLKIFAMTIFGGLGNFLGTILGAAVLQLMQPMLEKIVQIDPGQAFLIQLVIYGLGLVVLVRVRPQGLLPEGTTLLGVIRGLRSRTAGANIRRGESRRRFWTSNPTHTQRRFQPPPAPARRKALRHSRGARPVEALRRHRRLPRPRSRSSPRQDRCLGRAERRRQDHGIQSPDRRVARRCAAAIRLQGKEVRGLPRT